MADYGAIPKLISLNLSTGWDKRLFATLSCVDSDLRDLVIELTVSPITNQHDLNAELVKLGTTALDIGWAPRFPVLKMQLLLACPSDVKQQSRSRRHARYTEVSDLLVESPKYSQFKAMLINAYVDGLSSQLDRVALTDLLR